MLINENLNAKTQRRKEKTICAFAPLRLILKRFTSFLLVLIFLTNCNYKPDKNSQTLEVFPKLDPDYSDITIPPNIAPLNFRISEVGTAFYARFYSNPDEKLEICSGDGIIQIPEKKWKKLLKNNMGQSLKLDIFIKDKEGKWSKLKTIVNNISVDPIDPFLSYRLLFPGYEAYKDLSIKQRSMESFDEHSLIENSIADENCINCHTFNPDKSGDFLFHMRGTLGATYFFSAGELRKVNLKTKEMKNNAVYPRWHPSGKFIAFSSNKTMQYFHSAEIKKVEVVDMASSLILYDIDKNEIIDADLADKDKYMDTYPEWSPDGKYLYFCRAEQVGNNFEYQDIKYNLFRVPFDAEKRSFGKAEIILDASKLNKSVSFPRISPNGKFLVFTMHNYGCFPIWHKEADLYSIDLEKSTFSRLELNSDSTDSYHSWSSNSKWMVFSSKRKDGLTARPYIANMEENGTSGKAFILPQKDPEFYNHFLKTFNIPELSTSEIKLSPGEIREIVKSEALQAR
jgi:hypothetical protein